MLPRSDRASVSPRPDPPSNETGTLKLLQTACILIVGFWVFSPTLNGEFLFDDIQALLHRPEIHRWSGLWTIWFAPPGPDYFPLTDTVRWIQWHLWGEHPLGYHLTNVALHLLSALLLWRLLAKIGTPAAWVGGLLFAIHPVTIESVVWISELKNTLSLPFLLMAMLAYVHYDRAGRSASYFQALAAFTAATLSKTSVVMFPVVILLHSWWRHGRIRPQDWKRSVPFFAVSLILGLVTVSFQHHTPPGVDPLETPDPISRLLCAGLIIAFYLSKCFWPTGLDIVYFRWNIHAAAGWEICSWLLLLAFLAWLVTRRASWSRHALFGVLFFLINLVPVLGLVGMTWMSYSWVADHFVYLPLIGLVGLAAAAVGSLHVRFIRGRPFLIVIVAAAVVALAAESHEYAKLFQKSTVLWRHNLQLNPTSWLAYNNLGVALMQENRPADAIREFQQCLQLHPNWTLAYINWGNALAQLSQFPDAIFVYREAIALRPDNSLVHYRLGNALIQVGQFNEALEEYTRAVQINPDYVEARNNLAYIDIEKGHLTAAIQEERSALQFAPDDPEAHYNLGIAFGQTGNMPEAITEFAAAARLNPKDPEIQYNLGVALLGEGRTAEARQAFQRALQLNPHYTAAQAALDRSGG